MRLAIVALIIAAVAGGVGFLVVRSDPPETVLPQGRPAGGQAMVEITVPETLSENAQIGRRAFESQCADCHGVNAVGQEGVAPPLIHEIYEPGHHGDGAFQIAVRNGVRAHHWRFGNMPPIDGLTEGDVQMIVAYIRELQVVNGIE